MVGGIAGHQSACNEGIALICRLFAQDFDGKLLFHGLTQHTGRFTTCTSPFLKTSLEKEIKMLIGVLGEQSALITAILPEHTLDSM